MRRILRAISAWAVTGVLVAAACSDNSSDNNNAGGTSGDAGESAGGSSGKPQGGSSGKGGKGGSGNGGTRPVAGSAPVVSAGQGGAAGEGPACPGCASGFCLEDGTCVDCLPTNDQCADGKYCTADNVCVAGCKADGRGCASGVCMADHNCQNCISDAECLAPLLCNAGECSVACTAQQEGTGQGCDGSLICCSLHCSDLQTDSQNCGTCGHTCEKSQFCGVDCAEGGAGGAGGAGSASCAACHDSTVANVCAVSQIIVILDTTKNASDGNRVPGRAVGNALHDECPNAPVYTEAEQDSVAALNITSGRPVSGGGELLVVAGGPFYQNLEGYLEDQRIAPLYWYVSPNADTSEFRKSADDSTVVSLPVAGGHDSHDFFIVQFMRDPASGSLVLNVQGFWLSGTVAAAFQVGQMLPDLASFNKGWYAYEWTDKDGDKAPDANEITLIDSGD